MAGAPDDPAAPPNQPAATDQEAVHIKRIINYSSALIGLGVPTSVVFEAAQVLLSRPALPASQLPFDPPFGTAPVTGPSNAGQHGRGAETQPGEDHLAASAALKSRLTAGPGLVSMCRIRPAADSDGNALHIPDLRVLVVSTPSRSARPGSSAPQPSRFEMDWVFGPEDDNESVVGTLQPLLQAVAGGSTACVMAYGQSGSGKTYTMEAITSAAVDALFGPGARVQVRYVEIYNNSTRDLLTRKSKPFAEAGFRSKKDLQQAVRLAQRQRQTGETGANLASSRSHSILVLTAHPADGSAQGRLSLVDLGGAERTAESRVVGSRLTETKEIHKSLLAVAELIRALKGNRKPPAQGGQLAGELARILTGDCRAVVLATVSPLSRHAWQSVATLEFAETARGAVMPPARGVRR